MAERQLWPTLQVTTNEAVLVDAQFKGGSTGIFDGRHAEVFGERQHTENATNAGLSLMLVDCLAECADVGPGSAGASQHLSRREGRLFRIVFRSDAMPAAFLPDMLTQQLVRSWIENTDVERIPLDIDELANPTWRNAVIGGLDFDAAIEMNGAFAVLVVTEWLQR